MYFFERFYILKNVDFWKNIDFFKKKYLTKKKDFLKQIWVKLKLIQECQNQMKPI